MPTLSEVLARFDIQPSRSKSLDSEELDTLNRAIDDTIEAIGSRATWRDAEKHLLALGDIHQVLALLSFKYDVPLSERQRRIVREYDRWDVPEVRHAVFDAIRQNLFP